MTEPTTQPTTSPPTTQRPRHFVELDDQGEPMDTAVCGYLWDRLHVRHNGDVCQECVDELRRRGQWAE